MRRFILGSFSLAVALLTLPSEQDEEDVIGIDADCWMRIFWEGFTEDSEEVGS